VVEEGVRSTLIYGRSSLISAVVAGACAVLCTAGPVAVGVASLGGGTTTWLAPGLGLADATALGVFANGWISFQFCHLHFEAISIAFDWYTISI